MIKSPSTKYVQRSVNFHISFSVDLYDPKGSVTHNSYFISIRRHGQTEKTVFVIPQHSSRPDDSHLSVYTAKFDEPIVLQSTIYTASDGAVREKLASLTLQHKGNDHKSKTEVDAEISVVLSGIYNQELQSKDVSYHIKTHSGLEGSIHLHIDMTDGQNEGKLLNRILPISKSMNSKRAPVAALSPQNHDNNPEERASRAPSFSSVASSIPASVGESFLSSSNILSTPTAEKPSFLEALNSVKGDALDEDEDWPNLPLVSSFTMISNDTNPIEPESLSSSDEILSDYIPPLESSIQNSEQKTDDITIDAENGKDLIKYTIPESRDDQNAEEPLEVIEDIKISPNKTDDVVVVDVSVNPVDDRMTLTSEEEEEVVECRPTRQFSRFSPSSRLMNESNMADNPSNDGHETNIDDESKLKSKHIDDMFESGIYHEKEMNEEAISSKNRGTQHKERDDTIPSSDIAVSESEMTEPVASEEITPSESIPFIESEPDQSSSKKTSWGRLMMLLIGYVGILVMVGLANKDINLGTRLEGYFENKSIPMMNPMDYPISDKVIDPITTFTSDHSTASSSGQEKAMDVDDMTKVNDRKANPDQEGDKPGEIMETSKEIILTKNDDDKKSLQVLAGKKPFQMLNPIHLMNILWKGVLKLFGVGKLK